MKITLESGFYYFNVLDNDLASGITVERNVVSYELPDFFPGQPDDNLTQLEFIGSDDVRMFKACPITMNSKKWLRIATGKQFKMKVENNRVIVVYQV